VLATEEDSSFSNSVSFKLIITFLELNIWRLTELILSYIEAFAWGGELLSSYI